jgi:hypothetical protein
VPSHARPIRRGRNPADSLLGGLNLLGVKKDEPVKRSNPVAAATRMGLRIMPLCRVIRFIRHQFSKIAQLDGMGKYLVRRTKNPLADLVTNPARPNACNHDADGFPGERGENNRSFDFTRAINIELTGVSIPAFIPPRCWSDQPCRCDPSPDRRSSGYGTRRAIGHIANQLLP